MKSNRINPYYSYTPNADYFYCEMSARGSGRMHNLFTRLIRDYQESQEVQRMHTYELSIYDKYMVQDDCTITATDPLTMCNFFHLLFPTSKIADYIKTQEDTTMNKAHRMMYRNNRNPNKYILVTRYQHGTYYIKQYIISPATGVINGLGGRTGRGRASRVKLSTMIEILEDYTLVATLPVMHD